MSETAHIQVRIDASLKKEAVAVLAGMGLTVSDVMRMAMTKIARDKALPFEMHVPNALTAETLTKSERGEDIYQAKDANDLFQKLGI